MELKKSFGAVGIFAIASGAMISSGLFVLPGLAYLKAGPAVILAYLMAGILVVPSLLSKAELATAMPKSGGTYFFIERSLGPWAGTLAGLANWFSISFKSAFALAGMGAFGILIFPHMSELQMDLIAVFFCLVFAGLNLLSVKHTGRFQIFLVFVLLFILIDFVAVGVRRIDLDFYKNFSPHGMRAVFGTVGFIFVSFGGLTKVASVAEETRNPGRNLPLGMISAYLVVCIFYVMVVAVTVGVLNLDRLSGSEYLIPISLAARNFSGTPGLIITTAGALIAFITTANAGILAASRAPMAMARDRLLPVFFQKTHPRLKTPSVSIFLTAAFMIAVILFLNLDHLVKTASTMMILLFISVNLSVIIMRESKIHSYRPLFRAPFYPWLQIAAVLVYGFLIFEMGKVPLIITGGFIIGGSLWFVFYVRKRVKRQSALMHVVERITAKEMSRPTLEGELKDILFERDEISEDRFDRLIKECPLVEFDERTTSDEACRRITGVLAPTLKMEADYLFRLFKKREAQSSTVIRPGLAIPHILIEGKGIFQILIARSRPGIIFAGADTPVHAVFVLIGTMDERNYHLRALMAIAQITEDPKFDQRWLAARGEEELRNIILLARRRRGTD